MVEQLEFELIGTMTSKFFPPLAMMNKGVINDPVRIYIKNDVAAIVADIPIHPMICYEIANGLLDWLAPFKPKEVLTIAGIITNEPEKRVFGVSTTAEALQRIQEYYPNPSDRQHLRYCIQYSHGMQNPGYPGIRPSR